MEFGVNVTFEIKTAEELADPELEARWAARRARRTEEVFRQVLRAFVDRAGPVPVDDVVTALPGRRRDDVLGELAALDAEDLILARAGRIELAYPFAGRPTAFTVVLPGGRERHACCAIDALGIPPMLDARVLIRSACHHCGDPLSFEADAEGPYPEADRIMVWVGTRGPLDRKVIDSF